MKKPEISIVVCTYNGENLIRNCLDSILKQKLKNFEIICVDGMSEDKTQEIIKDYKKKDKRIKLIINKKRLPEGKGFGKWQGFRKSQGKIFGVIDQDNILQREDLFSKVKEIFQKNENIAGVLGGLKYDPRDKNIVKYVSLVGTDSFFAYRSIDFLRNIKEKWAKEKIKLQSNNMPLTGGNCFFYSKDNLKKIGGYTQDVIVIEKLVEKGNDKLFVIPNSTKHYAEKNLYSLIKKKFKWGETYHEAGEKFNYLPKTKKEYWAFAKNLLFCILIIPNTTYSIKLYKKSKDGISFLFPVVAFFNTIAYALTYLFRK